MTAASYYSGGGLGWCACEYKASWKETDFTPPGSAYARFTFGCNDLPRWRRYGRHDDDEDNDNNDDASLKTKTDAQGRHMVRVRIADEKTERRRVTKAVTLDVAVTDANSQRVRASTSFVLHPCEVYVGLRCDKNYILAYVCLSQMMC